MEAERVSAVLVHGRHLLEQARLVSDDVSTAVELLDSVDRRWTSLCQTASDVSTRLNHVLSVSNSFHHGMTSLLAWIELAEDRCSRQSDAVRSTNDVTQQLNNALSLAPDVERQRRNVDDVTSTGCQLLELVDTEQSDVEQQMSSMEDRWTTLSQRTYQTLHVHTQPAHKFFYLLTAFCISHTFGSISLPFFLSLMIYLFIYLNSNHAN